MERKATYQKCGAMVSELAAAILKGEVPPLFVRYNIGALGDAGGEGDTPHNIQVGLLVRLDEYEASVNASRSFLLEVKKTEELRPSVDLTEDISLGIVDLLEEGIKQGLAEIFPDWAEVIGQTSVTSYVAHSIGSSNSHRVQMILRFAAPLLRPGAKGGDNSAMQIMQSGVICYGTETIRASLECLIVFYNWLIWRLVRQENGKKVGKP